MDPRRQELAPVVQPPGAGLGVLGVNVHHRDAGRGTGGDTNQRAGRGRPELLQGDQVGRSIFEAVRAGGFLIGVAGEAAVSLASQLKGTEQRIGGGQHDTPATVR
jgi:hypothetical protein